MIEIVILLLVSIVTYFYYSFDYKPRKLHNHYVNTIESLGYKVQKIPFKPFRVPFVQKFIEGFTKHKDAFYFDKNAQQRYDFQVHNIMNQITLNLINPDLIRQFLSMEKIFIFPKKKIFVANMKRLLGDGVAFSQGQTWKLKRKIITSVFTFDFLKSIIPNISKVCDEQLNKAESKWSSQHSKSSQIQLYLLQVGFNIFSSVLMVSFFGMDSNKCQIQGKTPCEFITSALALVNEQARQPLAYLLGTWIFKLGYKDRDRRVNHIIKVFRKFASELVKQKIQTIKAQNRKQTGNYSDLIEALVYHYNLGGQSQNKNQKYSIEDVIDEFCTLLAAATDTTSHFFMMIVYYIVQTPEVQAKFRQQMNETFKTQEDMNYQNLKNFKYVDYIQEQVTRVYGPGTGVFLREATKDTQLLNIPIKKGTSVTIKPMSNHYNPQMFDEPLKFKPQRWQNPRKMHPYTIMGFSGGPRSCLGKHLTMLQTKIALIKLFKRFSSIQLQKSISEWELNFQFLYKPQKFMTYLKH